ncbi:MAG TPA: nucleotidyltransferase family protein [Virgibacillus sp.]|nr:nucleotidyltransferase family protein [Virgibacillus sp.]
MDNYEKQLIEMVRHDDHLTSILKAVENLNLDDAWVAAGVIRNKVWDCFHNKTTPINDIDVIYFDRTDTSLEAEKVLEEKLTTLMPDEPWSVKNQARMHVKNSFDRFNSSYDGVAHFPETATAIAIKLDNGMLDIIAPYGLNDLFKKIVKPTPYFENTMLRSVYNKRMKEKQWVDIWSGLLIEK